jgi:hypothetical protein
VFPNLVEKEHWIPPSTRTVLLKAPGLFLTPVVVGAKDVGYLYIVATEKDWSTSPDGRFRSFQYFTPSAALELRKQIGAIGIAGSGAAEDPYGRVAEEIVIFNVRRDFK